MKFATNIRRVSGNCWKVFQGRRSRSWPWQTECYDGEVMHFNGGVICYFYDATCARVCVCVCAKLTSWRTWRGSWAVCLITKWSAAVQCSTQVVFVSRSVSDWTSHRRAATATSSASTETAAVRTRHSDSLSVSQLSRLFTCLLPLCSFWKLPQSFFALVQVVR